MSSVLVGTISPARRFRNRLAMSSIWLSVLIAAVPLAFVVAYLVQKGAGVISWDFLTDDIPISSRLPGPGMGPRSWGLSSSPGPPPPWRCLSAFSPPCT